MIKVKGHENLFRDPNTGAIINTDRRPSKKLSSKLDSVENDINNLKEELSEIKKLLREIARNGSNSSLQN
jgi:archaellum component FlaC